ncbi:unnamed protein product, partial [Mesorhabditis belari]|uniref:Uncharacterized protein n=1 Tax=Mesorhabditis belari TaxID=2138241 RepID=A0AAF3EAM3_9BILA
MLLLSSLLFVFLAKVHTENLDDQLLADAIQAEREALSPNFKKINRRGVIGQKLENEVRDSDFSKSNFRTDDDYSDFEGKTLGRDRSDELSTVTLGPSTIEDSRPQLDSSEVAVGSRAHGSLPGRPSSSENPVKRPSTSMNTPKSNPQPRFPRMGYYFQHYPWWLLPRQYRLRSKDFGYVYPPQYQSAKYIWPGRLPYDYDPYAIYYQTQQARASSSQNFGEQNGSGYGNGATGGGFGEPSLHGSDNNQSGEVELNEKA